MQGEEGRGRGQGIERVVLAGVGGNTTGDGKGWQRVGAWGM